VRGEWVLITGAAGGLGSAMAWELAAQGAKLVLTDLHVESMAATVDQARRQGVEVICLAHDVSDRNRWTEIADELTAAGRVPRLLINNAGVAVLGKALDISDESWETVIEVDLWGVIHGCREFVPRMLAKPGPSAVLNVSSCSAYIGLPMSAPYCIAKAGVLRLTQSLQSEIDPKQVTFTCLCPGAVHTGIWASAARLGSGRPELIDRIATFANPSRRTPKQVARRAIEGALAGRAVVNVYGEAWLLDMMARLLPHQWLSWVNRRLFKWKFPELL